MISGGIKKYLINPAIGLLANLLYTLLFCITRDVGLSLIISIVFSGVSDLFLRYYAKASICGFIFLLNFFAFLLTFILWLSVGEQGGTQLFYLVVYEMIFFCLLVATRILKPHLSVYFGKNKNSIVQKTFLNEYFEVAKLTQYAITFHLFAIILYRYSYENINIWESYDTVFYFVLPFLFIGVVFCYEGIKTKSVVKHLRREEWLPIVNESGEVTGRIAKSVSTKMKNRFLHPVVRVALVYNGEIYLQKRPEGDVLDPSVFDHPFEKYMLFNHEINITVRNSISRALGMQELPFNFLLKYVYENENTKRLIFLFASRIENEDQLKSINLLNGKFWTMKQVEDAFAEDGVLSECFQLEYEYLKNTVLQSDLIRKGASG